MPHAFHEWRLNGGAVILPSVGATLQLSSTEQWPMGLLLLQQKLRWSVS
jgi:hypothetical protein